MFSDEIVALKRLKMEKEKEGFPITSLREINTILKAQHPNIVTVRVREPENYRLPLFANVYPKEFWLIVTLAFSPKLGNSCWQ